jgi:DNA-binding IclR family transcriptional regulator
VSELARLTSTSRGTTYQRLQTLVAAGWVEPTGEGKYRLTLHALEVGSAVLEQADLGSRILPTLNSISARTGETSSLAVLDGGSAMIIQRVASDHALKADIKVGTRMPLDRSASGRVLVAFGREGEIDVLRESGVSLPAPNIIDEARRRGYAYQHDEYYPDMSSVAVPIRSPKAGLVALAITAPSSRYNQTAALEALRSGADELSVLLRAEREE